ncbi:hypothetical protein EBS02_05745 [bacterium]|nr:hypothetical protein [bacterium]
MKNDLYDHLKKCLVTELKKFTSLDFEDKGLSGIHFKEKPMLIKGLWLDRNKIQDTLNSLNKFILANPIKINLLDKKTLVIYNVDLVMSKSDSVYFADVTEGKIV